MSKAKQARIHLVAMAIKTMLESNTVIANKQIGIAASVKVLVDPEDNEQIEAIAEKLLEGGL